MNGYLATEDNHDSWGMCTTSVECRTIMTVVLTVMSDVDPHMISETWDGFDLVGSWPVSWFTSNYHSGLCGRFNVALRCEELLVLE
jgi:hypothetical protein